jgi:hypothetical protein
MSGQSGGERLSVDLCTILKKRKRLSAERTFTPDEENRVVRVFSGSHSGLPQCEGKQSKACTLVLANLALSVEHKCHWIKC